MNATEYEQRVQQMAEALHRDCELIWQARYAIDPHTQPDRWDAHRGAGRLRDDPIS